MFRRFFSAVFDWGLACGHPAGACADEIETKAQLCAACHGDNGVPTDPKTIPVIWGQERSYLMKQLRDFRNGERNSAVMSPIAKGLAEDDLRRSRSTSRPRRGRRGPRPQSSRCRRRTSPSARPVISRTSRAACRPRGSPGSAMNIWSRQCAPLPPSANQQPRHAEVHAGADRPGAQRHRALSLGALTG